MNNTPEIILKQFFNFDSFREKQKEIIDTLLINKKHTLVVMPTGGGKSLCYQIPALCFEGGTLVISPLIALMQDQVDVLRKKNIPANFINSTVNKSDKEKRLQQFIEGKIKLLYVTPERFRNKDFNIKIKEADISLLAIDEAHCISEWGHDFRPDYSRIGEFRKLINNPLTIALTATATPDVQKDIIHKLLIEDDEIIIFNEGIERPNLRLEVRDVFDDKEKTSEIEIVLNIYKGSGIIYFSLIQTLEKFSEILERKKINHEIYHGKLPDRERKRIQRKFLEGEEKLILATNAFGMGIDKANIRFVIHYELPSSIESYYQEIGRAGRDGEDSLCLLLYNSEDLYTQMEFIKWSNPGADFYSRLYGILAHDSDKINSMGIEFLREQLSFKNKNDFRLETALGILDRFNITTGTLTEYPPQPIQVINELPEELTDEDFLKEKLLNDNKKLYSVVEYFKEKSCRKIFISKYFGIDLNINCGNCDNCS